MKMANMDAVTGFMFTDPKKEDGVSEEGVQGMSHSTCLPLPPLGFPGSL